LMEMLYGGLSPDGVEHFPVVAAKGNAMIATEPTLTTDDLRTINVPALVIAGDDDLIDHHHTVDLFEALPDARLAIVPGASHVVVLEKAAAVGALIAEFLADPSPPTTMLPVRRA
jgi:pimeloyl-ACP methyl ester carboxylesterase